VNADVRSRLAAEVRESAPRAPGVYAFLDGEGRLLYIGKSVNLRRRIGSYFARDPLAADLHLGQLVSGIRGFAWCQTRSELLALLMEDALIKEHLPPHNTRQRETLENRYLELTADEFPSCVIVEHEPDFGSRDVYGPMKDWHFAERLRDILSEAVGIRVCPESTPSARCLRHDLGRCAGPCREVVTPGQYRELVNAARAFLAGDAREVLGRLTGARDRASDDRRFEEAARLQEAIETCRRYEVYERFARDFVAGECSFRCERDGIEYRFDAGTLLSPRKVVVARGQSTPRANAFSLERAARRAVSALHGPSPDDPRVLADRARIVCGWSRRRDDDSCARVDSSEPEGAGAASAPTEC
jgi:hypothetical protein